MVYFSKYPPVLVLFLLFGYSMTFAQSVGIGTSTRNLGICGQADTFTVSLQNNSANPITGVGILLDLPAGIEYLPGSASGTGIFELSNPSPDSVFLGSADLPPFQSVDILFLAKATCAATDSSVLLNGVTVTSNLGVNTAQSLPYAILRPSLAILSVIPTFWTGHNDTVIRQCITVANGGLGALRTFSLLLEADSSTYGFANFTVGSNGLPLSAMTMGDSTWVQVDSIALVSVGNLDPLLADNEQMTICFDAVPRNCDGGNYTIKASWGCEGEICEEQIFNSSGIMGQKDPELIVAYTENDDDNCRGNGSSVTKVVVENIGADTAHGVILNLIATYNHNFAWDTSTVLLLDTLGGISPLQVGATYLGSGGGVLNCYNGPLIRSLNVLLPDMAPGARDTIQTEYIDCCLEGCNTDPSNWNSGYRLQTRVRYLTECDPVHRESRVAGIFSRQSGMSQPIVSGPIDLLAGDTAVYCLAINNMILWNADSSGYLDLALSLPDGLSIPSSLNGLYFEDANGVVWYPSSSSSQGDTTFIRFPIPLPTGYSLTSQVLKIPLTGNCTNSCGGAGTVHANFRFLVNSSCACPMSIQCAEWNVNLHCPNCPCNPAGLVFTDLEVRRMNYGQPDNDDNGQPDPSGTLDLSRVATDLVIFGDTLGVKLFGVVDTTGTDPFFVQGHAKSFIPSGSRLQPVFHELKVVDHSSGLSHSAPIPPPDTSSFSNALGTGLAFQYAFDTSSLGAVFGNGYVFEQGDSLILDTWYKVVQNVGLHQEGGIMEHHYGLLEANGDTVGCDTFSGSYKMIGYAWYQPQNSYVSQLVCDGSYYPPMGLFIGPSAMGQNIFRYEFRNFGYPDTMTVGIPDGHELLTGPNSKVRIQYLSEDGGNPGFVGQFDSVGVLINNNILKIPLGSRFAVNGGSWALGDEEFRVDTYMKFVVACELRDSLQPGSTEFQYAAAPSLIGPGALPTTYFRAQTWAALDIDFDLETSLARVPGITETVAWDLQVTPRHGWNNLVVQGWLRVLSPSGQMVNPVLTQSGSSQPLVPQGGWYPLGNVYRDQQVDVQLQSEYGLCNSDSILVQYGFGCIPPDSLASLSVCPFDSIWLWVDPQPSRLQAIISLSDTAIDVCDSLWMEVDLRSAQLANVKNVGVELLLPIAGGLGYVPGTAAMTYPVPGSFAGIPDPVVTGNRLFWDIDSVNALIAASDFQGINTPDSNQLKLRFALESNCNFVSGQQVLMEVSGNRPCGDRLPPVRLLTDPITINGAPQPYTTNVNASLAPQSDCPFSTTLTVAVTNNGPGFSSPGDSISVDLPNGYQYAGNYVSISNAPTGNPNVQFYAGGLRLVWPYPTGLGPGDLVEFAFDIVPNGPPNCRNDLFPVSSLVNTNLFCARTNSNCSVGIQTGTALVNNVIALPALSFQTMTGIRTSVGSNREYQFNGTLSNSGSAIPAGDTVWIEFYCDSDQNASYGTSDILLGQYPFSGGIGTNGTINFGGTVTFPANSCGDSSAIIAVLHPDLAQGFCLCDSAEALHNPPLSTNSILAKVDARPDGNLVSWIVDPPTQFQDFWIEQLWESNWNALPGSLEFNGRKGQFLDPKPRDWSIYRVVGQEEDGTQTISNVVHIRREVSQGFKVFPNPTAGTLQIEGAAGAILTLFDVYGKTVGAGALDEHGKGKLEFADLPSGVYVLMVREKGIVHLEKVIRAR